MNLALYFLLNLAVLTLAAWLSRGRRFTLFLALLAFGLGVGMVNSLIEAVAFAVMSPDEAYRAIGGSLVIFILLAAAAVLISGRAFRGETETARPRVTAARLALVVLAYELLYFGAGMLVYPYIADFYATRRLPPIGLLAGLAGFRALLFVAWTWPLLRLAPRHAPWLIGLGFAVIAGIAPLLPDNPYMPADIRFYHAIETGISNFLFGWILAWLLQARSDQPAGTELRASTGSA
jgi:hypothetical protein